MAETGKKGASEASVEPKNNPAPSPPGRSAESTENDTEESKNASVRVRTVFPHSSFTVQGVPTITDSGTMLTKTQLEKVEKLAPEYDVELDVEEVK